MLVTAWRLATSPTSTSPFLAKATTEGVVRAPSAFAMTVGSPPSRTATTLLVVPRSMPTARAMVGCLFRVGYRGRVESDRLNFAHSAQRYSVAPSVPEPGEEFRAARFAAVDLKAELHAYLQVTRGVVVAKCEGLSEYDVRRPVTASGTSLLGLVKHLIGMEQVYLGTSFGRPTPFTLPWVEDGSIWDGADMWATEDEPREWLLDLYAQACAHGDETVAALDLDSPGSVPHWDEERPRDHARRAAGPDGRRDRAPRRARRHLPGDHRRPGPARPRRGRRRGVLVVLRRPDPGRGRRVPGRSRRRGEGLRRGRGCGRRAARGLQRHGARADPPGLADLDLAARPPRRRPRHARRRSPRPPTPPSAPRHRGRTRTTCARRPRWRPCGTWPGRSGRGRAPRRRTSGPRGGSRPSSPGSAGRWSGSGSTPRPGSRGGSRCRPARRSTWSPPAVTWCPASRGCWSARTSTPSRRRPAPRTTRPGSACCSRPPRRWPATAPGCRWCWWRSARRSRAAASDEDHHYGSTAYVASLTRRERRTLRGMVAMDRVGVGDVVPVGSAYEPDALSDRAPRRGPQGRGADAGRHRPDVERPLVVRAGGDAGRPARQHVVRRVPLRPTTCPRSSTRPSSSAPPGWWWPGCASDPDAKYVR